MPLQIIDITGEHRALIPRALAYLRAADVSETEARSMLEKLCSIAFRDGVCAADARLIAELKARISEGEAA